jgi:hypothetical protein
VSDEETKDTQLQAIVEEQKQLHIVHERRLTEVETRMTVFEVRQSSFDSSLQKLTEAMTIQANKATLNEAAITAIKERTDLFAQHMETAIDRLTDKQEDSGKEMASLKTQMNVVRGIGAALVGAGALVALEHFFH